MTIWCQWFMLPAFQTLSGIQANFSSAVLAKEWRWFLYLDQCRQAVYGIQQGASCPMLLGRTTMEAILWTNKCLTSTWCLVNICVTLRQLVERNDRWRYMSIVLFYDPRYPIPDKCLQYSLHQQQLHLIKSTKRVQGLCMKMIRLQRLLNSISPNVFIVVSTTCIPMNHFLDGWHLLMWEFKRYVLILFLLSWIDSLYWIGQSRQESS